MIAVGVTGSRNLLVMASQFVEADQVLRALYRKGARELHHGDCVGADAHLANFARHIGYRLICHPPENSSKRAWVESDETRDPLPYLDRNQQIVDETDCLIAMPDGPEVLRSGTWATVRRARAKGIPIKVIAP